MKKKKEKPGQLFRLRFALFDLSRLVLLLTGLGFRSKRIHVSGRPYREKLKGGGILAMNHTGFSDPFAASNCFWYRRVYYLVGEAVMKGKLRSFLLRGAGCIRIDRNSADLEAVKTCVGLLRDKRLLVIFPQGQISQQEEDLQLKHGAVLMALQADVPIIPMYTQKRSHWYQRKRIVIGDPVHCKDRLQKKIPSMKDMERISEALRQAMDACRKTYETMEESNEHLRTTDHRV